MLLTPLTVPLRATRAAPEVVEYARDEEDELLRLPEPPLLLHDEARACWHS